MISMEWKVWLKDIVVRLDVTEKAEANPVELEDNEGFRK
jgi:hypothetical protein